MAELAGLACLFAALAGALWLSEHTPIFDRLSTWLLEHAGGWGEP